MIDISEAQIAAAKARDAAAASELVEAMDERTQQIASRFSVTMGQPDRDLAEDLAQEGRLALWLAIPRFEGSTPAQFFSFAESTLRGAMSDKRKEAQRQGVSRATAARFERCLSACGGDPMAAERMAQTDEVLGDFRLSAEMAELARLSWQGEERLDGVLGPHKSGTPYMVHSERLTYEDERQRVSEAEAAATRAKVEAVRATLDGLAPQFESILSAEFGIGDYALALGKDWDELAEAAGVTRAAVESVECEARAEFRRGYLGGETKRAPEGPEGAKTCKCCGITKDLDSFHVRNKVTGARLAICKTCKRSAVARRASENREGKRAQRRAYRERIRNNTSERGAA